VLELGEVDIRDPGPGEIAIAVRAAGLNRADVLQRRGLYPAPPGLSSLPNVPGLEYAGTVVGIGTEVRSFAVGDRVMGIVAGGGMCTRVVVHEREAIRVPEGMPLEEAAAVPEVFLTAYDALFTQARLSMGEVVLLHAVTSGVGTAALQLATVAGSTRVGTSRSEEKLARLAKTFEIDHAIVTLDGKFAAVLEERLRGRRADVILDTIGAAYLDENVRALAELGRIVIIGLLGGVNAPLPLALLLARRGRIFGSVLRARPLEEKAALAQAFTREVLPLFASGRVRPVIDAVLPMDQIREAHRRMEHNETFGKLVLDWGDG